MGDGLARQILVDQDFHRGLVRSALAKETAVSKVKTEDARHACSPIGKVQWVTMPIAPTGDPCRAAKRWIVEDSLRLDTMVVGIAQV